MVRAKARKSHRHSCHPQQSCRPRRIARHAADDALGAYRGSIGDDMDEAQRAEFNRLFGVVQASSKPIGDFVNRESWSDDDRVVMDLIMSLPLDQLKSLK